MDKQWQLEFDEYGGYDCMTAAYRIKDEEGETIAEIDLRHYGQRKDGAHYAVFDENCPFCVQQAVSMKGRRVRS